MAQDEHTSKCSNSSGGGCGGGGGGGGGGGHRSTKKLKHKKVPQRGMGVAQLEKIISEEHQKTDSTDLTHDSIISPSNSSSNLQKLPNFRPAPISSCSIPPPPPLPPNHHPLMSKIDAVSKPPNLIGGGGNWSRLWSGGVDYKFEGEKQSQNQNYGLDHPRFTAPFPANLSGFPYESNPPIWPPPPNLMLPRSPQHFQSSSVVANTSSSSSVMHFQMEPPSNQIYSGNNYQPLWPEEEKMVGMKRPYPFSLENVPIPSFHCKFPSAYISRSDEYASCSNGGTATLEPANPAFRENSNPSSSGVISDGAITKKFIDENQILTRDFLKLAPPQTSQSNSSLKESLPLSLQKDPSKDPNHLSGRDGSYPQPFLSFFPAAKTPMDQAGSSNGETRESVDLNLKL